MPSLPGQPLSLFFHFWLFVSFFSVPRFGSLLLCLLVCFSLFPPPKTHRFITFPRIHHLVTYAHSSYFLLSVSVSLILSLALTFFLLFLFCVDGISPLSPGLLFLISFFFQPFLYVFMCVRIFCLSGIFLSCSLEKERLRSDSRMILP